jgi:glycosyltransferase involved in cell wall biosynthesis
VSGMHPAIPAAGGVRPYVLGLAHGLRERGVDVSIVGAGPELEMEPIEFCSVTPKFPLSNYEFIKSLWLWVRRHAIEAGSIVHAQRPDDLYPFVRRTQGCALFCTLHGDPARGVTQRRKVGRLLYAYAEGTALKAARHVISVSYSGLQRYRERYPWLGKKSSVVPVGIDLTAFHPQDRRSCKASLGASIHPTVLYAGRLEPEKRVNVLLDAARDASKPFGVLIAGNGTLESTLRAQATDDSVRFLGCRENQEMPPVYAAADALVLPSAFEGMPTVALEALACGTPVVATRVGDLERIVEGGQTGYFFDGTARDLRLTIDRHAEDFEGLRPTCANAGQLFGWARVLDRVTSLYVEAAS